MTNLVVLTAINAYLFTILSFFSYKIWSKALASLLALANAIFCMRLAQFSTLDYSVGFTAIVAGLVGIHFGLYKSWIRWTAFVIVAVCAVILASHGKFI